MQVPQCTCGGWRVTCGSHFSLSMPWVLDTALRLSGLGGSTTLTEQLTPVWERITRSLSLKLTHWLDHQASEQQGSFRLSPLSYRQACSAFYKCDRDAESGPQACALYPTEDIHKLSNASSPAPLIEKLDSIHQCHLSFPKSLVCTRCLLLCLHTACRHVQLSCHLQSSHSK